MKFADHRWIHEISEPILNFGIANRYFIITKSKHYPEIHSSVVIAGSWSRKNDFEKTAITPKFYPRGAYEIRERSLYVDIGEGPARSVPQS